MSPFSAVTSTQFNVLFQWYHLISMCDMSISYVSSGEYVMYRCYDQRQLLLGETASFST